MEETEEDDKGRELGPLGSFEGLGTERIPWMRVHPGL